MKKSLIIVCIIIIFFIIYDSNKKNKMILENVENGRIQFNYGGDKIQRVLYHDDLNELIRIFNGKGLYSDNPSCGFSENIAIYINDNSIVLCLARDGCPVIFCKNKGLYFRITDKENECVQTILKKYGIYFPCI